MITFDATSSSSVARHFAACRALNLVVRNGDAVAVLFVFEILAVARLTQHVLFAIGWPRGMNNALPDIWIVLHKRRRGNRIHHSIVAPFHSPFVPGANLFFSRVAFELIEGATVFDQWGVRASFLLRKKAHVVHNVSIALDFFVEK